MRKAPQSRPYLQHICCQRQVSHHGSVLSRRVGLHVQANPAHLQGPNRPSRAMGSARQHSRLCSACCASCRYDNDCGPPTFVGDRECEEALWAAVQRLTREELGAGLLCLLTDLELQAR